MLQKLRALKNVVWSFFEVVETLAVALVAVFLVRTFIAQPFLVSGGSMEPNFTNGNYLLVDELSYRLREPERGEIIVFKYPKNHKTFYIKRVIGLPGETIKVQGGKVEIQTERGELPLKEEYIDPAWTSGNVDVTLGENEFFVMGDNRNFSYDSRSWGPVKENEIVGIVRLRLWPVNEVMAFGKPAYE
ncbi:MAG: signal peptidase I [Candidatus Wolfebacteria bacterium]|nr:signal peptidase I [Candidatus Wolfebacteria bacterium]